MARRRASEPCSNVFITFSSSVYRRFHHAKTAQPDASLARVRLRSFLQRRFHRRDLHRAQQREFVFDFTICIVSTTNKRLLRYGEIYDSTDIHREHAWRFISNEGMIISLTSIRHSSFIRHSF